MNLVLFLQQNIWATSFLLLLPIIGWLAFFDTKQHEKRKNIILAFLAGMISVLPIKLYEKYWSTAIYFVEHINIFQHLNDLVSVPSFSKFLAFTTVSIVLALGIYIFILLAIFLLEIISGDSTVQIYKKKIKVISDAPFLFIIVGLIIGLVAYTSWLTLHEKIWFFLLVGMIEEFTKHLCVRFSDEEKICSVDDALAYSIIVALGFAFLENILYFNDYLTRMPSIQELGIYFVLRSSVSVLAHVSFSAIFGYYYGLAQFSTEIYKKDLIEGRHKFLEWTHRVCHIKGSTVFHEEKMLEGLVIAMLLHAAFNSLLEFEMMTVMLTLLVLMVITVLNLYHKSFYHKSEGNFLQEN